MVYGRTWSFYEGCYSLLMSNEMKCDVNYFHFYLYLYNIQYIRTPILSSFSFFKMCIQHGKLKIPRMCCSSEKCSICQHGDVPNIYCWMPGSHETPSAMRIIIMLMRYLTSDLWPLDIPVESPSMTIMIYALVRNLPIETSRGD